MAGVLGFEPRNGGTKTRCLTTWLHPNTKIDLACLSQNNTKFAQFCNDFHPYHQENFKHTFFVHVQGYFRKSFQNMMSDGKRVVKKMVKA